MTKLRLDQLLVNKKLAQSRSQAENIIKLGQVKVGGKLVTKPGTFVDETTQVGMSTDTRYVSRAGLKLASVAESLGIYFQDAIVLDVGSSTGGFTDYALQNRAKKVFAIDVGTDQLHSSLRTNSRVELHEKTDIRDFTPKQPIDIVVMDVSFISLREILPHIATIVSPTTCVVAMLKPQFEAGKAQVNKGVIKNDAIRRQILRDFENWVKQYFVIVDKKDSEIAGSKGNRERFYLLKKARR